MSRSAKVAFDWADGTHEFRLAVAQIEELQEKTSCGPYALLQRIASGTWMLGDVRETIRLGLIGGGMKPVDALRLVRDYVDERPLLESVAPARTILMAALMGAPDGEKPGKRQPAKRKATETPATTGGSPLPDSTPPGP